MDEAELLDEKGKEIFKECLDQYHCKINFTKDKYNKVDCYFGKRSVGEIKYRQKEYPNYILEENKVYSLLYSDCPQQYYIVVFDDKIYIWDVQTVICKYKLKVLNLPTDLTKDKIIPKPCYLIDIKDCDFIFNKEDGRWKLIKFEP